MLVMLCALMPLAMAQAASIANPSLVVEDSSGNKPVFDGSQWNLTGGTYTVSGTAQNYEGLKIAGDVTLNLNGAAIQRTTTDTALYGPAIDIKSGAVQLNLLGDSTVQGSPGNAGIHVSEGAALTISGARKPNGFGRRWL